MDDIKILDPGQRLKELRKKLKVKQEELAGEKFSKNYISMFENNRRNINAINATYLANKINALAEERGKSIKINAAYLLKNKRDIAVDKCERWLNEVEANLELSDYEINLKIYKCIILSSRYNLNSLKGRSLYLKGITSLNNKRYHCAVTQFLDSLTYYSKEKDFGVIVKIYESIGITLYKDKQFKNAIVYFNLSDSVLKRDAIDYGSWKNISYFKALCYYELGEYNMAKRIITESKLEGNEVNKLDKMICRAMVG